MPLNPSFPLTLVEAKSALAEMAAAPRAPARPLVIAAGIHDPGIGPRNMAIRLRRLLGPDATIVEVQFFDVWSMEGCRDRLIRAVDAAFPGDDPEGTVEVDVVGISMGGLVARYAARPAPPGCEAKTAERRLRIARLFTIATPHVGAALAGLPVPDPRVADMRCDGPFIEWLARTEPDVTYRLIPYVRLGDVIVGPDRTAPEGQRPWWVANLPGSFAHMQASSDKRLLADIARRLRGETPYATEPRAPLPGEKLKAES